MTSKPDPVQDDVGPLTEPMSVQEFSIFAGVAWRTARSMLDAIPGIQPVGQMF